MPVPVPTTAALEVGVLFHGDPGSHGSAVGTGTEATVLLASRPDQPGYVLPGGPVEPNEGIEGALGRYLREWAGTDALPRAFVACVETGGGDDEHELTIVFAVEWSPPARRPATVRGATLVDVPVRDLAGVSIRPDYAASAVRRWVDDTWPFWQGVPVDGPDPRWGQLRQSVAALRAQLSSRKRDLRGPAFRDASIAICALVAAADGRIDQTERDSMLRFVTEDEMLAAYPPHELERGFDTLIDRLRDDPAAGREVALREIAKVRGRPVEARSVVQLGAVIGRADGNYDDDERAAVADAMAVLGLDASTVAVQAVTTDEGGAT